MVARGCDEQDTPRTGTEGEDTEGGGTETEGEGGGDGRPPPPPDPDEDPNTPPVTPMASAVNTAFDALSLNKAMVDTLYVACGVYGWLVQWRCPGR